MICAPGAAGAAIEVAIVQDTGRQALSLRNEKPPICRALRHVKSILITFAGDVMILLIQLRARTSENLKRSKKKRN